MTYIYRASFFLEFHTKRIRKYKIAIPYLFIIFEVLYLSPYFVILSKFLHSCVDPVFAIEKVRRVVMKIFRIGEKSEWIGCINFVPRTRLLLLPRIQSLAPTFTFDNKVFSLTVFRESLGRNQPDFDCSWLTREIGVDVKKRGFGGSTGKHIKSLQKVQKWLVAATSGVRRYRTHPCFWRTFLSPNWAPKLGVCLHIGMRLLFAQCDPIPENQGKTWGASKSWVRLIHGWIRFVCPTCVANVRCRCTILRFFFWCNAGTGQAGSDRNTKSRGETVS